MYVFFRTPNDNIEKVNQMILDDRRIKAREMKSFQANLVDAAKNTFKEF